ncbi:MAG: hypothetical protein PUC18_13190 [Prevotellaceae bacterium]|nr:hypothetical protein [Prevotellaceae bacterium]
MKKKFTMSFLTERGTAGSWEHHGMPLTIEEIIKVLKYWVCDGFTIHHLTIRVA